LTFARGTLQCASCHVATYLTSARAHEANVSVSSIVGTYTSVRPLSTELGAAAATEESVRGFGWLFQYPAISQRVVDETAETLDEIDARYPPATTTTFLDAGVPDSAVVVKRVFLASAYADGDLKTAGGGSDGLTGGDALCAAAATRGHLGGMWTAWLSTSSVNAIDRITGDGPWYLVDQTTLVFANKAAITGTGPAHAIDHDELDAFASGDDDVWTGTNADGTASAFTCNGWTSAATTDVGSRGIRVNVDATWTSNQGASCNNQNARLYCFEQ
jgi:hypothetical protein